MSGRSQFLILKRLARASKGIIFLDDDPLKDIHVMEKVSFVMKNGVIYKQ